MTLLEVWVNASWILPEFHVLKAIPTYSCFTELLFSEAGNKTTAAAWAADKTCVQSLYWLYLAGWYRWLSLYPTLVYLIKISFFFLLSGDLKKGSCPSAAKSNLPKPCQSGLRPPGYSRLPAAKLAAFGFVRSSSVSSVSSNQSNESTQSDQSRTTNRKSKKASFFLERYYIDVFQDCPVWSLCLN